MDTQPSQHENNPIPAKDNSGGDNAGSIIGIIIIVLVFALGGLYFWRKQAAEDGRQETPNTRAELGTGQASDTGQGVENGNTGVMN